MREVNFKTSHKKCVFCVERENNKILNKMEGFSVPIILDQFNSLYVGGNKGRKFEIRFCPKAKEAPWSVQSRGNGHYFQTLRETLAFAAGRGWIDVHMISSYQIQIMDALAKKWEGE